MRKIFIPAILVLACLFLACCGHKEEAPWVISAPAGNRYTKIDKSGQTVIPNGRIITPRGRQVEVAPHPYGLALSPDGSLAVTANSGVAPFSISIIRDILGENPAVRQIPQGARTDRGILAAVFMGLAVSPDNKRLYAGGGQEGGIYLFDLTSGEKMVFFDCDSPFEGRIFQDSYIGDLALGEDGHFIYAVDQANFRLVILDTRTGKLAGSVPVGRYPFGVTLSPDGDTVYVANVGMFEYSLIQGIDAEDPDRRGLKFPPFAYLSPEAEQGVEIDGFTVPGLGDPNVPESFSVWEIDVKDPVQAKVTARIKTGWLVGQLVEDFPAVGGASPNSVVATSDRVYVSNGNGDSISVIDTDKDEVIGTISLQLDPRLKSLRGAIPFGLALSPDGTRLYAAEAGINAVAVIDLSSRAVLGHIPVGWFPSKIAVSKDGKKMIVANAKGYGSGPNGGPDFEPGPQGSFVGNLMNGTVSVIDIPPDRKLKRETRKVIANNFKFRKGSAAEFKNRKDSPIPMFPGEKESPIKHIVFIIKENRTFDEVFGGVEEAEGEASLARYGAGVRFSNRGKTEIVENATVMVNHLELAGRFSISDNFNCDSDVSADGHRWLAGVYPNEWTETNVAASYGGGRRMNLKSNAPGSFAFTGTSGVPIPEDYTEAGTIWDHLDRHGVDFFNFGFGLDFAPNLETPEFEYTGLRYVINYPMPAPLFEKTSRTFASYNMGIPDQFRAETFIQEFDKKWISGDRSLPPFLVVYLPNDHGAGEFPENGYPFRESYMADNDLALGKIVDFLSHSPYWKSMAIFITEDDPQGGVDHIDAHRSILMAVSPYAKKDAVSHVHTSFGSIMKTFWNILGVPPLNQYDAGATDLADMFTDSPDFTPYTALPVDPRIFRPEKALSPLDEDFNWEAVAQSPVLDDPSVMQRWMEEETKKRDKNK